MERAALQQVRRFNRTVAARIGALDDRFLGRARPMGESRILWEVGSAGAEIRELRARLGLDSGYVSRVLHSLERQALVTVQPGTQDRRVRRVQLTPAGLAERAELDRRSDEVAQGFLEPLSEGQQTRLVAAMAEVEQLLTASQVQIGLEDAASADAQWCIAQYFQELAVRFEGGFDAAHTLPADASELTPPAGAFAIARLLGRAVGCAALKMRPDGPADIKRMWVSPEVRGLGVGRRLLEYVEAYASEAGVEAVRLETNRSLIEAIALYRSSGYEEVAPFNDEPYAHHWFEKRLR